MLESRRIVLHSYRERMKKYEFFAVQRSFWWITLWITLWIIGENPNFWWINRGKMARFAQLRSLFAQFVWRLIHRATGRTIVCHLHLARLFATLITHTKILARVVDFCPQKTGARAVQKRGGRVLEGFWGTNLCAIIA